MERYRTLVVCGMMAAQIFVFLTVYHVYIVHRSQLSKECHCNDSSPIDSVGLATRVGNSQQQQAVQLVWYYEHVYEHPPAKLRVLTETDGAAPLNSKIPPRRREITLVTQTSGDRLKAVEETAMTWGGAFCVAVHVRVPSEIKEMYAKLQALHARIEARNSCRLYILVAIEDGFNSDKEALEALYPVNALRNIALRMATTDLVFILDADFIPSPRLHESLTEDPKAYGELLRRAKVDQELLVVPAFETVYASNASNGIPATKEELTKGWRNGSSDCFHCARSPKAHMPTDFQKYFDPKTTSSYLVQYREFYEPYFICAANSIPLFDERFRGYGKNKQAHSYSCAAKGMTFRVLNTAFVYSRPHPASDAWKVYLGKEKDPLLKMKIVGLYRRFKTEIKSLQASIPNEKRSTTHR